MHKISKFLYEMKSIPLTVVSRTNYNANTFTIIVGKNGVGKSRLLSSMVNEYSKFEKLHSREDSFYKKEQMYNEMPKVIAVSTSPFDKFKLPPKPARYGEITLSNYRYIGMRTNGLYAASAISLLSSATKGLLDFILEKRDIRKLGRIFNTLGFESNLNLSFRLNYEKQSQKGFTLLSGNTHLSRLTNNYSQNKEAEFYRRYESKGIKIDDAMKKINDSFGDQKSISISIDFNEGVSFRKRIRNAIDYSDLQGIRDLLDNDFIRLMDLKLTKKSNEPMSLRRASSGEQCMLVMMLGIAGNVGDGSLVFIDEPEISLHPEWQEEFMPLLIDTFSEYRGCQFFIATHSPQIVSSVNHGNCFVTSLEKNKIYPSSFFSRKSSDFQLAELFESPGFRNEYISRLSFNLLSKIRATKKVDATDMEDMRRLENLRKHLDKNDPTCELISSIREVVFHYASH